MRCAYCALVRWLSQAQKSNTPRNPRNPRKARKARKRNIRLDHRETPSRRGDQVHHGAIERIPRPYFPWVPWRLRRALPWLFRSHQVGCNNQRALHQLAASMRRNALRLLRPAWSWGRCAFHCFFPCFPWRFCLFPSVDSVGSVALSLKSSDTATGWDRRRSRLRRCRERSRRRSGSNDG